MLLPAKVDSAICTAFTRSVLNSSGTFPYLEIHLSRPAESSNPALFAHIEDIRGIGMKMLAIRHEHTTRMLKLTFLASSKYIFRCAPNCTSHELSQLRTGPTRQFAPANAKKETIRDISLPD